MEKIAFDDFKKMMESDVMSGPSCIEVEFCIDNFSEYDSCWLGKMGGSNHVKFERALYWYGLKPDGSQPYDFESFDDFVNAPVFRGKSIKEIWDSVTLYSIDGCTVDFMLPVYLGLD